MIAELEISSEVEKIKFKEWVKGRLLFLPGNSNPEKWIVAKAMQYFNKDFAANYGLQLNL